MFVETTFGDLGASGADTVWFALGWPNRKTWKAQGRPNISYADWQAGARVSPPSPGLPPGASPGTTPADGTGGQTTGAAPSSGAGGGGGLLSGSIAGIPILWIVIGLGLFVVMKK